MSQFAHFLLELRNGAGALTLQHEQDFAQLLVGCYFLSPKSLAELG